MVDAILYLGPQDLRLKEQIPADIALDIDYMTELQRRESLTGFLGSRTRTLEGIESSNCEERQQSSSRYF